jgi:hypothetical protein
VALGAALSLVTVSTLGIYYGIYKPAQERKEQNAACNYWESEYNHANYDLVTQGIFDPSRRDHAVALGKELGCSWSSDLGSLP